jgi:membrane-associated phospholipid phosphatase
LLIPIAASALEEGPSERPKGSPFRVDLAIDLPILVGSGAIAVVPEAIKDELSGPWCGLSCDPDLVNALDRTVVGNWSRPAAVASDVLLWTTVALPHVAGLLDTLVSRPADGFVGYGKDALVLVETLAIDLAVTNLVKLAARRPRPYVYDDLVDADERTAPDAARSFFSGHTSMSFCMATAYSHLFTLRHPRSPWIVPVWLGTHALAATTGYLRIHAGKHFWTDVIAGAAVGSAIGLLVTHLHRIRPRRRSARPGPESRVAFRLMPALYPGGLGLTVGLSQ